MTTFIRHFCVSLALISSGMAASPYDELREILPFEPHGWYANANTIERLIQSRNVKTIIEVGCWLGKSTRHMASLVPHDGRVYAVDHWNGSEEHQVGQTHYHRALPLLYEQFLSNVIHAKLTDKIIPIRMDSLTAAKWFGEPGNLPVYPDLIYIDASHDFESVYADLKAWYPLVKGHGILCGDDWHHQPIVEAVRRFSVEEGLLIETGDNCWYLLEFSEHFSSDVEPFEESAF